MTAPDARIVLIKDIAVHRRLAQPAHSWPSAIRCCHQNEPQAWCVAGMNHEQHPAMENTSPKRRPAISSRFIGQFERTCMIRLEETIDSGLRRVQRSADSLQNEKLEPNWLLLNRLVKRHPKCLSNSQSDTYAGRFDDIAELCLGSNLPLFIGRADSIAT